MFIVHVVYISSSFKANQVCRLSFNCVTNYLTNLLIDEFTDGMNESIKSFNEEGGGVCVVGGGGK